MSCRRRSAVEPVIGHLKDGHRMDRNFLAGRPGDAANAVLAAAGYNFRLLVACSGRFGVPCSLGAIDCVPGPGASGSTTWMLAAVS